MRITPCFKSAQMITVSVLMEGVQEEVFITFVYAYNLIEERKELWSDLKAHQDSPLIRNKPWIVCGDFNEILEDQEHSGHEHSSILAPGMGDFQEAVSYCSLLDMSYHGPKFTWCNKREGDLICKKLDRTLINGVWMRRFPQAYCVFEAGGCLDHQRCRISITADQLKPKRPFKFTNAVDDMPEFLPLVKSFWDETVPLHISTSTLFRLGKKLKSLKPLLRKLSKDKIGDIVKKTKEAYIKLCTTQTQTLTDPTQLNMEEETKA